MFIPHTDSERKEMLKTIGVNSLEDLFKDVPETCRFPDLNLPEGITEMEAIAQVNDIATANGTAQDLICFLGAGAYNHYIPAAIDNFLRRGEFLTSYTPYQPEISQGTLQAIFEYQSLVAKLTGMDVCNASHYDGATATAEAGILAYHSFRGKRNKIVVSSSINPQYLEVLNTYIGDYKDLEIVGANLDNPFDHPNDIKKLVDDKVALVLVQYPDFFGRVQNFEELIKIAHEQGTLFGVIVNPISLGILKTPGELGADIVVGDGQPLGIPMSFGGPYLGIFAFKKELVRKVSGRLVGETVDGNGRKGYVLTLTAREQHIRREKATSNICSNQGLMALASTVYLSLLGKDGFNSVAQLCYNKAHYAADQISQIPGYELAFDNTFFNEFVVKTPHSVEEINMHILDHGVLGGFDLGKVFPDLSNHMLLAVTEKNTKDEIDYFVDLLKEVSND